MNLRRYRLPLLRSSCLVVFILFSSLFSPSSLADDESEGQTKAPTPTVLTGGVEHAEELGSVDQSLRIGKPFSQMRLPKLDEPSRNLWFRIPNWMAGQRWVSEHSTKTYEEDLRTHTVKDKSESKKASAAESWGWQKDKNGDVWQYDATPFTAKVEGDKEYTMNLCYQPWEQLFLEPDRMVVRVSNTDVEVNKKTNQITQVLQKEVIMTFTQVSDGVLKREYSSKVFDEDGQPVRMLKGYSISHREKEFSPWNRYKNQDLIAAFAQFLTDNGKTDLIPPHEVSNDTVDLPFIRKLRNATTK